MASTNKTTHLGLSQWVSEDCPKMDDFNQDNQKVDTAIHQHVSSQSLHLTAEQAKWLSSPLIMGTYEGNGEALRTINLGVKAKFVIVSVMIDAPYAYDPVLQYATQSFAMLCGENGNNGIDPAEDGFTVYQSMGSPPTGGTFVSLNATGYTYWYMAIL